MRALESVAFPLGVRRELEADVEGFTGPGPREDDQTVLVARLAG